MKSRRKADEADETLTKTPREGEEVATLAALKLMSCARLSGTSSNLS